MDFRITRGTTRRTLYLIGANLFLSTVLGFSLLNVGERLPQISVLDVLLEGGSGFVAFLLFAIVAQLRVAGARMGLLLIGLFLYQGGAIIDALDELVRYPTPALGVVGGVLALLGEIILVAVAFHFVQLTLKIANTDRLTELQNRAFHNRWIENYLERSAHPLGLIAIDLDNFKAVNDANGHAFGDGVLRHIGALLNNFMAKRSGIVSRTGGEEFEITLKRSKEVDALRVAEEIRLLIEQNPPVGLAQITGSIGVAISQEGESVMELRKRADAAAYYSKQSGRNRVSLAGGDQTISSFSASP